jgi:hypothetical protein
MMKNKTPRVSFNHSIKLKDIKVDKERWEKIVQAIELCQSEILMIMQCSSDIIEIEYESIATLDASQVCLQVDDKRWFHNEK